MNNSIPANSRLTASDNAVLRYNIHLNMEMRNKLKRYFRLLAKSDIFASQINDSHPYKEFIEISGQHYEIAYRDCGLVQLEEANPPLDLLLSLRAAHDNNVRVCLVTPLTPEMLSRMDDWQKISWLQPANSFTAVNGK